MRDEWPTSGGILREHHTEREREREESPLCPGTWERSSSPSGTKRPNASASAATPSGSPPRRWCLGGRVWRGLLSPSPSLPPFRAVFPPPLLRPERQKQCDCFVRPGPCVAARCHDFRRTDAFFSSFGLPLCLQDMVQRLRPLRDAELLQLSSRTR